MMEAPALMQVDLYFAGDRQISAAAFQTFIDRAITPLFPDGLTVFDASGRSLHPSPFHHPAPSSPTSDHVVSLFVEDTPDSQAAIEQISAAYTEQFAGTRVLQVENRDDLKVGFGVGENLIDNDPIPELIQVDLFFGRNIAGVGEVSEAQFRAFVDQTITPRFPDGLTIFDTDGQFLDSTGTLIEEPSKVVSLILEDTQTNETAIDEIVTAYRQQFQQESVLQAVNESITVSFDASDDLIDNDAIPEPIQVDLFFGRNIPGGGEVSQAQFQTFINQVVTPLFPNLTVFDADGQYLDSSNSLIEEQSKVVSLVFADTAQNEADLNAVVESYIEQFHQESVLVVVDEEIASNSTDRNPTDCSGINLGIQQPNLRSPFSLTGSADSIPSLISASLSIPHSQDLQVPFNETGSDRLSPLPSSSSFSFHLPSCN